MYLPLGGIPTDDEQATGLEREVLMAAKKGLVRNSFSLSSVGLMVLDGIRLLS